MYWESFVGFAAGHPIVMTNNHRSGLPTDPCWEQITSFYEFCLAPVFVKAFLVLQDAANHRADLTPSLSHLSPPLPPSDVHSILVTGDVKQAFTFGCEHDRRGDQGGKNIINLKISPLPPR